ncbi:26S proteasome non-ATPase regulatory subunit 9 [Rhynchocyon petersi]
MSEEMSVESEDASQAGAVTVSDVKELMRRKEEIEAQIKANYEVLESQKGIGMNEPLVDCEDYPRSDVDLYQVRTARHNIVCLQNDHKAIMKQVEEALHQLHARDKEKQARDMAEAQSEAMSRTPDQGAHSTKAFAKVNSISPGSPASTAGLQVDDEIVEFGSVNTQNFQSLQNVGSVVQHSEGKPLNVTVIRRGERHQLRLVPTRWAGKGLLGTEEEMRLLSRERRKSEKGVNAAVRVAPAALLPGAGRGRAGPDAGACWHVTSLQPAHFTACRPG